MTSTARTRMRAVFLAALMVLSVVAISGAFAGSAAAQEVDPADYDYAVNQSSLPDGVSESDFNETYDDISAAVDAVDQSNTTLLVFKGDYSESIQISQSSDLEKIESYAGADETAIEDGVTIEADDVAINGFNITNPDGSFGVSALGVSNVEIASNTIHDIGTGISGTAQAVYLQDSTGEVANNDIDSVAEDNEGSSKGVFVGDSTEKLTEP